MKFEFNCYRLTKFRARPTFFTIGLAETRHPYRIIGRIYEVCLLGVCFQLTAVDESL